MASRRDALAARREALGFTQEELARQLGVELSTVGRWERGTLTPQPWRRPNLARLLQISLPELDKLLNPTSPAAGDGHGVVGRREIIVETALLSSAVVADYFAGISGHSSLTRFDPRLRDIPPLRSAAKQVSEVHQAYQAAQYTKAAQLLPSRTAAVNALVVDGPATVRREALSLQCSLNIAAAKLATKAGNAPAASTAAEQARAAAEAADDVSGQAAAAYQRACALLRAGRSADAERVAVSTADAVRGSDHQNVTWRGMLSLISAIIAARRADATEAFRRLDHADHLARRVRDDSNIGWTAFGPTNVLIHRMSVAVALGDPHAALAITEVLDTNRLPAGLRGRQAQFHLDSAWAHAQLGEDSNAVIHLLDTERVAPELVRSNPSARTLIGDLLARERLRTMPGLRALAHRAGVAT